MRQRALPVVAAISLMTGCGVGVLGSEDPYASPDEPDPWSQVAGTIGEAGEPDGRSIESGCKQTSGFADGDQERLTYEEIVELARGAGIGCGYNLVKAVAVASAESGRYTHAYLRNKSCSLDRGIWQINSYWWGDYSTYDTDENAAGMYIISKKGTTWTPWATYNSGKWKSYRTSACAVVKAICGKSYC